MKVLVTGINGFAGSHLAEALLSSGHSVSGIIQPGTSLDNISGILNSLSLFEADLLDENKVKESISRAGPDAVVHLAALSNVKQASLDPALTRKVNVRGTSVLLSSLNTASPSARFIFASSSGVYGQPVDISVPVNEDSPIMPLNEYAQSKAEAEKLVLGHAQSEGLDAVIARPSNHTGPGQSDSFFVSTVARQAARISAGKKEPVMELGNLGVRREILDVRDVARAYIMLLEKGRKGEIYNISSGKLLALSGIVDTIVSFTGKKIEVKKDPLRVRQKDHDSPAIDFSKLQTICGWQPHISIDRTLRDTYDYWLQRV